MEQGDPRDVICSAAEKMGVDMVVLGSHGYGLIKRSVVFLTFYCGSMIYVYEIYEN